MRVRETDDKLDKYIKCEKYIICSIMIHAEEKKLSRGRASS